MSLSVPHIGAIQRDLPSYLAGPPESGFSPITFPQVPLKLKVEFFLGGAWVDATKGRNGVLYEPRVKITRGRPNESTRAQPSSCKIILKNPDRYWSPRNVFGPYFGKLGRNVKMRVTVNPGDKDYVRFTGFISGYPQQWTTGEHRYVSIQANGVLRRLGQGKAPLKAAIFRAIMAQNPTAYWPLSETADATVAASAVVGGASLTPLGNGAFAGTSDTPAATAAYVVNAGQLSGFVSPTPTGASDGWVFAVGIKSNKIPLAMQPVFSPLITVFTDSPDLARFELLPAEEDPGFPGEWDLFDSVGTFIGFPAADPFVDDASFNNQWKYYQVIAKRVGLNLTLNTYYEGGLVATTPLALTSPTAGNITRIEINNTTFDWSSLSTAFSDISVIQRTTIDNFVNGRKYFDSDAFIGYVGETPTNRFARLCEEEDIPYKVAEADADTETMGPQKTKALLDLLRECEASNEGVIDETVDAELRLISRSVFWNQPPIMQIDYNSGAIKEGFLPTDDDLMTRNDWTVTRDGGNERQYVQTTGPLSVNDPASLTNPGVGKYDDAATLSLETDDQAFQHASLRVARGTVDEMRIAAMPLHFSSLAGASLLPAWLRMDMADTSRFLINNPPADMGPRPSDQIMTGYSESIDRLEWTTVLSGAPASSEQFGVLDFYGWVDCGACYLAEDLDASETGIDVQISDTCWWYHDEGDYRITIRGEDVIVTAVSAPVGSGSSWTQTLTVVRAVNSVAMTHPTGTQIFVTEPFIPTL